MPAITVAYHSQVEVHEYITINGRTSRIHYNNGYAYTSRPGHSYTIGVHRLLMELHLGRRLTTAEHVHHKDGDRANNALDNLEVVDGRTHNSEHTRKRNLKHDPDNFVCIAADCVSPKATHKGWGLCDNCWSRARRRKRAIRPCGICCRETVRAKVFMGGLCARCATKTWAHCRCCRRTKEELPKNSNHGSPINPDGLCRAYQARIDRQQKLVDTTGRPSLGVPSETLWNAEHTT